MKNFNNVVGDNLKCLREEKGLSLDKVAEITGVSKSMLGQIERGETNPTINTLWKIGNGLKVPITSFINQERTPVVVISLDKLNPVLEDQGRLKLYTIFPYDNDKRFELFCMLMEAGCNIKSDGHFKGVEEYITVYEGEIEMCIGDKKYRLCKGNTINFLADIPHSYQTIGEGNAVASMMIYYPS